MGAPIARHEELPSVGRTNAGPSCHDRTIPYYSASNLRSELPIDLPGGVSTPFTDSIRVSYVGHRRCSYPNVLRGTHIAAKLSRICSIRVYYQADDSLLVLASPAAQKLRWYTDGGTAL